MLKKMTLEQYQANAKRAFGHFDFKPVENSNSESISSGTIVTFQLGALKVRAFKSMKVGPGGHFLVSAVFKGEQTVWNFSSDEPKGGGIVRTAFLLQHRDEGSCFIAVTSGRKLFKVIPLDDLEKCHVVEDEKGLHRVFGGKRVEELIELKKQVAFCLGLEEVFSKEESELIAALKKIDKAAREEIAAKERKLIREVLDRQEISVYRLKDGRPFSGQPATEDEWPLLPGKVRVVLVDEYTDGCSGNIIEAFIIRESPHGKEKSELSEATTKKPEREIQKQRLTELPRKMFALSEGRPSFYDVVTPELLKVLQDMGVNNGTPLALDSGEGKPFLLIRLVGKEVEEVGKLQAIS